MSQGLALRVRVAIAAAAYELVRYSDDQPRDEHGRWSGSGSGSTVDLSKEYDRGELRTFSYQTAGYPDLTNPNEATQTIEHYIGGKQFPVYTDPHTFYRVVNEREATRMDKSGVKPDVFLTANPEDTRIYMALHAKAEGSQAVLYAVHAPGGTVAPEWKGVFNADGFQVGRQIPAANVERIGVGTRYGYTDETGHYWQSDRVQLTKAPTTVYTAEQASAQQRDRVVAANANEKSIWGGTSGFLGNTPENLIGKVERAIDEASIAVAAEIDAGLESLDDISYIDAIPPIKAAMLQYRAGKLTLDQMLDQVMDLLDDYSDDMTDEADTVVAQRGLLSSVSKFVGALGSTAVQGHSADLLDRTTQDSFLDKAHAYVMDLGGKLAAKEFTASPLLAVEKTASDRLDANAAEIFDSFGNGDISFAQARAQYITEVHADTWNNYQEMRNELAIQDPDTTHAWWETDDPKTDSCDDCAVREEESPYLIEELPGLPCDGSTQCGPGCLCTVRYGTVDEDGLERIGSSLTRWNPDQARDEKGRWTSEGASSAEQIGPWVQGGKTPLIGISATQARNVENYTTPKGEQQGYFEKTTFHGVEPHTEAQFVAQTIAYFNQTEAESPQDFADGLHWYETAQTLGNTLADQYGIDRTHAYAVIASLSPATLWDTNVKLATEVMAMTGDRADQTLTITPERAQVMAAHGIANATDLIGTHNVHEMATDPTKYPDGFRILAMTNPDIANQSGDNLTKAFKLANGASIDETLGGPKVRSFYDNIQDGGKAAYVTIDTHQIRAMYNAKDVQLTGDDAGFIFGNTARYEYMAQSVRHATEQINATRPADRQVTPPQVQAVVWTHWRNTATARNAS